MTGFSMRKLKSDGKLERELSSFVIMSMSTVIFLTILCSLGATQAHSLSGGGGKDNIPETTSTPDAILDDSYSSGDVQVDDGLSDVGGEEVFKCVCDGGCEHLRAEECRHGVTFDMCRCCLVCARGENEPCGGAQGTCAFGLHCQLNDEPKVLELSKDNSNLTMSTTPTLSQEGICSRVGKCDQLENQYGCMVDPEGQCVCLTRRVCPGEKMFLFEDKVSCQSRMAYFIGKKDLEPAPSSSAQQTEENMKNKWNTNTTTSSGNCSQVKCPQKESCPEDSYRLPLLVNADSHHRHMLNENNDKRQLNCCPSPSTQKCQCIPDLLCSPKECPPGWVTQIIKNATGKPGGCCPKFDCVLSSPLSANHAQSHHHVHRVQSQHHHHQSDFDSDVSFESSSVEDDDDNSISDEISRKENKQRQRLLSDESSSSSEESQCYHAAKIYKSGERWSVQSECSECFCERGLVSCKPISCNVPAECRLARTQPLSCCPICDGCVSSSGKAYNMSETWMEDPCTNCTCRGGRIQCHTSSCKREHSCDNLKYYPGECCPRCEGEAPDPGNVMRSQLDKNNCQFQECHREISCPNGFRLDKSGCPTCECQKCQSLLGCKLLCSTGFQVDSVGCNMCKCRGEDEASSIIQSNFWSRNGNTSWDNEHHQLNKGNNVLSSSSTSVKVTQRNLLRNPGDDNNGNKDEHDKSKEYHQHHQHHQQDNVNNDNTNDHDYVHVNSKKRSSAAAVTTITSESPAFCAVDSDGARRMEREEWSDHCRRCICLNGREMCSLITCQPPNCEHPIFYPGDCCPRCPVEGSSHAINPANVSICLSSDGTERLEGEIWMLSPCLSCTCHSGKVLCAMPECPPTPCASPKLVDCCLECPNVRYEKDDERGSNLDETIPAAASFKSSKKTCFSDDSFKVYQDGETWKVGACESCLCETGKIKCFSAGKCPSLDCDRPILVKNQCCPICLEKVAHKTAAQQQQHHGVEGAIELHHLHSSNNIDSLLNHADLHHDGTTATKTSRVHGSSLEPHCAMLIACLLVVTILLSLYIVRQMCFHRRVSRRIIKKVPIGFHSASSSSHSPVVTPDCCYRCDYSKYCTTDSSGCVVVACDGRGSASTLDGN